MKEPRPRGNAAQRSITEYRRRMKRRGIVRVEVHVRQDDAALIRDVARALDDPRQADEARTLLRTRFSASGAQGLKAFLSQAPLEDVDLTRPRDSGRDLEL